MHHLLSITGIGVSCSNNELAPLNKEQLLVIGNVGSLTGVCYTRAQGKGQGVTKGVTFSLSSSGEGKPSPQAHRPISRVTILDVTFHLDQLYKITAMSKCPEEVV